MHLDVTKRLTTLAGDELKDDSGTITLGAVACNSLLATFEDERSLSGEDKVKRFKLACRIQGADVPVEMTPEDAALIKKMVAKLYGALVTGQVWEIIDNCGKVQHAAA